MQHLNHGQGLIPARIMLVGDVWSNSDEVACAPFSGTAGQEFNRMLHEAKILRSDCYATNVVNARPPGGYVGNWVKRKKKDIAPEDIPYRDAWVNPIVLQGIEQLLGEIRLVQPNIIIALGDLPLWVLTGLWGVRRQRGSQLYSDDTHGLPVKVIPTLHPVSVMAEWSWRQIAVTDLRRAKRFENRSELTYGNEPQWNFTLRPSFDTVVAALTNLIPREEEGDLWLDIDIETRANHIACLGIGWSKTEAICIPLMCVESQEGYWSLEEETAIVLAARRLLTHPNVRVRWQNGLFDAQYIYRYWLFIPNHGQDTMLSHHVMFAGLKKALDFQASMYCDYYRFWKDDGKTWTKEMGEEQLWSYNCEDCVRTREVGEVEQTSIPKMNLDYAEQFQQRLWRAVLKMMNRGIRVNKEKRAAFALDLQEELSSRESWFFNVLGHSLNPASSPQMLGLFYTDLGQRPIMSRPTKASPAHPTCNDEALEILKHREPLLRPLIQRIAEYRSLGVFLSTFVNAPLDVDGRLRCSFNICGTETYRFASSKNAFGSGTNFQNIPKGGDDDEGLTLPNIRELFIPDEGMTFYDIDLSKADLRIVVWESDCREMKAMLREGKDPYIEIAREFYRDPTITKKLPSGGENPKYRLFKSFAHGTHYLGTPQGLARRLGLTVHEADRTQRWYFERNPEIRAWQNEFVRTLQRTREVRNVFGFKRYYFDRIDDSTAREAIAWLPQSTVAIYINHILVSLDENSRLVQPLLQVHDSLPGQFPTALTDAALADLRRAAEIVLPYDDPLVIPIDIKTSTVSWGACE